MAGESEVDATKLRRLEKRLKRLEKQASMARGRSGGAKAQAKGQKEQLDYLAKKIGKANLFEKFGWITFPSSWYVGDWGIADITDTPRYQVMGGLVVLRILIARGTAATTSLAIEMDPRIAPSRNMYTSTLCGSSLDVVGNANVGAGGRVDIYGPYPESNTQTFIHIIYPYEP